MKEQEWKENTFHLLLHIHPATVPLFGCAFDGYCFINQHPTVPLLTLEILNELFTFQKGFLTTAET